MGAALLITAAAYGTASSIFGANRRKEQRRKLREQRDQNLEFLDLQFDTKKKESFRNADRQDEATTMTEGFLANNVGNSMDQIRLQQEQEGLAFNTASMQSGAQRGAELSQMAASGTRSSSMAQAVDLESAVNAAQLQAREDAARASDEYSLNGVLAGLSENMFTLQNNRTDAADLRASYGKGGSQYEMYKKNREMTETNYDNQIDEYKNNIWSVMSDFFGGAQQGYSLGKTASTLWSDIGSSYMVKGAGNQALDFSRLKLNGSDIFKTSY